VAADELHHGFVRRREDRDRDAPALLDARQQRQRLVVQLAGVERGHRDGQAVARDQVGQHHVLGAQAGGLHDGATMLARRRGQHGDRVGELGVVLAARPGVQRNGVHQAHAALRANQGCVSWTSPW
jgi:hypothetical protein